MFEIGAVGVVGAGTMGSGIAHVFARAGAGWLGRKSGRGFYAY